MVEKTVRLKAVLVAAVGLMIENLNLVILKFLVSGLERTVVGTNCPVQVGIDFGTLIALIVVTEIP